MRIQSYLMVDVILADLLLNVQVQVSILRAITPKCFYPLITAIGRNLMAFLLIPAS